MICNASSTGEGKRTELRSHLLSLELCEMGMWTVRGSSFSSGTVDTEISVIINLSGSFPCPLSIEGPVYTSIDYHFKQTGMCSFEQLAECARFC